MNEWIWERGGLACSVKVLLVKAAGKYRERNDTKACALSSTQTEFTESFDATKYYHRMSPVPQHFQSKCSFVPQTRTFSVNIYL